MIALDVSSAAGPPPHGGIGGATRRLVEALVRGDPATTFGLGTRPSRWRRGPVMRLDAPNARTCVIQDPWNALLLRGARLLHALSTHLPRTPRIPKLVTIWDVAPLRHPEWVTERWRTHRGARIRAALARADAVVATSRHAAGEIEELLGVPAARIRVAPLGVDVRAFRPLAPAAWAPLRERHGDFALAVGLLAPRKNFARLAEAVARVEGLRLVVVGRDSHGSAAFGAAVERHGLAPRVTRLARVSDSDLVALINAARVVAVPSLYEGFGLSVLEAMACGTPVVCSDAASLPEVAGDAALTVDARDPEALADALRRVLESPSLTEELRVRGLTRARAMSWERAAAELRAIYRDVAGV